jgi:NDP-sugar pyrophosphorylase family protein
MRPYTDDRPKAMAEVAGWPIVAHRLAWLRGHGVTEVVISVGYRAEVLQDYVQDGARFELHVRYAVEQEPLGRGGGLRFASSPHVLGSSRAHPGYVPRGGHGHTDADEPVTPSAPAGPHGAGAGR